MAAVDPDLQREAGVGVGQASDGAEHPAFTVLASGRNPCGDDDLAAVAVDVGGQERQLLGVDGLLRSPDHALERRGHRLGAAVGHQGIDAREPDEPHRRRPVLLLDLAAGQVGAQTERHEHSSVSGGTDREAAGPMGAAPGWRHRSFQPGPTGAPAAPAGAGRAWRC